MADTWDDRPIHPIIDSPHEYEIVRLDYHIDPDDSHNSFLDLVLRRGASTRRLRFFRPQRLVIEEGFPSSTHGMIILDIRDKQWDDLQVEVADFEASLGSITFCAAEVIDLDAMA